MEGLVVILFYLLPVIIVGWILSMASRAVKALESIAESLRQQKQ